MIFAGIFSDTFYHYSSYATTICSCIGNSYLIYAILVTKVSHIGPYRWLLLSFAVVDVCISIVHSAVIPLVHLCEFGYIFWGNRFINDSSSLGFWLNMCWVIFYYQTFILLGFHYIYRYVVVCNPPRLMWLQSNNWANGFFLAVVADVLFTGSVCYINNSYFSPTEESRRVYAPVLREVYGIDLFSPSRPEYFAGFYWQFDENGQKIWQIKVVGAMVAIMSFFFGTGVIITFCIVKIVRAMRFPDFNMSSKLRIMQRQLFQALLWQPIHSEDWVYVIAAMCAQLFPMIDPVLVFFFVQAYREALPSFMQKAIKQAVITAPTIVPPSAMTL